MAAGIRNLGAFIYHQRRSLPIVSFLLLFAAAAELFGLASLVPVATALFHPGSDHLGIASSLLLALGSTYPTPLQYLALVALAMLLRGLAMLIAYRLIARSSTAIEADGSIQIMRNTIGAQWGFLTSIGAEKLLDAVIRLPYESAIAGPILAQLLVGCVLGLTFTAAVAFVSPPTLLFAIVVAVPLIICLRWTARTTMKASAQLAPAQEARTKIALDLLNNAKYFKIGGVLAPVMQRFSEAVKSVRFMNQKVMFSQALMIVVPDTIVAIGLAALIGLVYGLQLDDGSNFLLALMLIYRAFQYANQALSSSQALARYLPSYFSLQDKIAAAHAAAEIFSAEGEEISFHNKIILDRLCFSYLRSKVILQDFSAEIRRGEIILLRGESGAGKTTVLDLISGLLTPESGTITIDQQPLRASLALSWRRKLAYIPQEPPIFSGTIRSNLLDANVSMHDADIFKALQTAQMHDIVQERPDGLDWVIGERGASLSGGQRQRLLLARALLSEAEVILLDEPTSAVDPESEALIFERVFKELRGKKTLIIAAHRFELDPAIGRTILIEAGSSLVSTTPPK